MVKYRILTPENAQRALELRFTGASKELQEFLDLHVEEKGDGPNNVEKEIRLLLLELKELINKSFPSELRMRDERGREFESIACEIIHKILSCDQQMMSDKLFWIWLAVDPLYDIVAWRHGGMDRPPNKRNFGVGASIVENLFYRMWLRAEMVYDKVSKDPYHLARKGDQDFWRSHIFRQSYSNVRPLAQELVKHQFSEDGASVLKTLDIRDLAKRLRRVKSNMVFEFLSQDQLTLLIQEQSKTL